MIYNQFIRERQLGINLFSRDPYPRRGVGIPFMGWIYLVVAIIAEVVATSALKASEGFTRPFPLLIVAIGYGTAFFFLSLTLRTVPIGIVYAIWSGLGMVLIGIIGWLVYKQALDTPAVAGMALIVMGVIVMKLFSKSSVH